MIRRSHWATALVKLAVSRGHKVTTFTRGGRVDLEGDDGPAFAAGQFGDAGEVEH